MSKPDYRTLLRHAGMPESEVERIAQAAERDDAKMGSKQNGDHSIAEDGEVHPDDAHMEWERGTEKLIAMLGRKTGVEAEGNHGIYIEGNEVTVTLSHSQEYPLAQLMDFANKIASEGVGSNLKVGANSNQSVVITFDLIQRG